MPELPAKRPAGPAAARAARDVPVYDWICEGPDDLEPDHTASAVEKILGA